MASWYEEETDYLGGPQHWADEEPDVYEEPPAAIDEAVWDEPFNGEEHDA